MSTAVAVDGGDEDLSFLKSKKKKKKPRKAFDIDGAEAAAEAQAEGGESKEQVAVVDVSEEVANALISLDDKLGTDFSFPTRKVCVCTSCAHLWRGLYPHP